jgi:hypothetical protein
MEPEAQRFLKGVYDELAEWDTTSRHLVAIVFDPVTGEFKTLTRIQPHADGYPELRAILEMVAAKCTADRIDLSQLRRIAFLETEINLEWVNDAGQLQVSSFPL